MNNFFLGVHFILWWGYATCIVRLQEQIHLHKGHQIMLHSGTIVFLLSCTFVVQLDTYITLHYNFVPIYEVQLTCKS